MNCIEVVLGPSTDRIIETALYVADIDRAAEWYRAISTFQ